MKWLVITVLLPVIWSSGCHQAAHPGVIIERDSTLFSPPERVGTLANPALAEVSGLAPSLRNPGYLWTEEDSGNPNQIQLINPNGAVVRRFTLPVVNRDWEDIATGSGPVGGQTYVYLADIGDNKARAANQTIYELFDWSANKLVYRFPEPALTSRQSPATAAIRAIDTITLTLPDGPKDAEAILVDPATSDIFLLAKGGECAVYRAAYPQSLTAPVMMEHLLTLPLAKITAAAISPDGTEILIRNYKQLFYYERGAGESVAAALRRSPRMIPLAFEPQGEAIGWRLDGSGYYSTSETWHDETQGLYFYRRQPDSARVPMRVNEKIKR